MFPYRMSSALKPGLPRIAQPWALKDLPPFRPVAVKLLRLAAQENASIDQVRKVVRTDSAFSAEVLRFANSALIGSRARILGVGQAIETLGMERIKGLAMTIALRDFFPAAAPDPFLRRCWKYNLATAILSEWLAGFLPVPPEVCYSAGIVHDIGRFAILRSFPKEYEKAVDGIDQHHFDLLKCEKNAFEIDHCEAGQWLTERWEFPQELRDVACLHHRQPSPDTPLLVTVVYIAWQIADMLGLSPMATRSAATIEEITATLAEPVRRRICAGLGNLPELVSQKLYAAESVAA